MKILYVIPLIFSAWVNALVDKTCSIAEQGVMNCSGLGLTDCPQLNDKIRTLILDFNLLTNLSTSACRNITGLRKLSVRNNALKMAMNFKEFSSLSDIDLSGNQLNVVDIVPGSLLNIDVSSNVLIAINLGNMNNLQRLNVSHNNLNNTGANKLIKSILRSNQIEMLDVSYNNVTILPREFTSFTPNKAPLLNFSGNKLTSISFSSFQIRPIKAFSLDVSHNQIASCVVTEQHIVHTLDLSHNRLPMIEADHLDNLIGLSHLDLSANPLRCLCNETAAFIDWVKQHSRIVVNPRATTCKFSPPPSNQTIMNITCTMTTTSPSTTITTGTPTTTRAPTSPSSATPPAASSTGPVPTEMPPVGNNGWKIVLGVLITLLVIILAGLGLYFWWRRRNRDYALLGASHNGTPTMPCDCFPLVPQRSRSDRNLIVDPEENTSYITHEDHLSINDSLSVICSAKDTQWFRQNIGNFLDVKLQFIDTSVIQLPYADFTLIFVNGNSCLKDDSLANNVKLALQEIDQSEIRLLINVMPDFSKLKTDTELTTYLKRNVRKKGHYFFWDSDNKASCLLELKSWLQSHNVPQNV